MDSLEVEARLFTHYLIGRNATPQAVKLYRTATKDSMPNDSDAKLLSFMCAHPSSIGLIDAGLIFVSPESEARRRLYVMLAILESSTEYHDLFLPKKRKPVYVLSIILFGASAVIKAFFGVILVKALA